MDGQDPGCDQQRPLDQVPERVAFDGVAHGLAEHFGCGVQRECHRSPPLFRSAVPNKWPGRAPACGDPDSGTTGGGNRPELHRLLDQLRDGDTLVVWKLDRLSRSLKDLLHILERVEAVGARFRSLTEAVDTAGPAGRMLMQMLGSFAEFERAMVRELTRAGLKAATARGRKGGRQPKLTPEQKAKILDGLGSGRKSAADLARLFRVHRATISRLAAQMRVVAPGEGLA